ncbi:MAG: cation-translocating P-type ATPase [Spongiibacteraceae bacterium]
MTASVNKDSGLNDNEVAAALEQHGYNELPSAKPRPIFAIAFDVMREPMLLLLFACGAIYLLLGDERDAAMLLAFVAIVLTISIVQRHKSERALDALKNLSSPRAQVIRNGIQQRIPGREVVVGDLVVLSEGDRVPADGILLTCLNLQTDESLLTGESIAAAKISSDVIPDVMPAPRVGETPYVYAGSLVVAGKGIAQILATGGASAIGNIAHSLATIVTEPTLVEREIKWVVKRIAIAGLALSALIALIYTLTRDHWLDGLLAGITAAMALLPEELPVVLMLFFSIGAWRIAQRRVLTRNIPAIEMLGSTSVLCVDKTGTLTENKMLLCQLDMLDEADGCYDLTVNRNAPLPEKFHELLEFSVLASHRDPFDPMERALHDALQQTLADTEHVHKDWKLLEEYPLSRELLAMSRAWQSPRRDYSVIAAKGAPEAIADLCHLNAQDTANLLQRMEVLAEQGLRVLAVARAKFEQKKLPEIQHDFIFELVGLISFIDPVRAAVPTALRECNDAGVRVVMITGDHPATALNIAAQIDLDASAGYLTGAQIDAMDQAQLLQQVRVINVFCRVTPEHKLQLVEALKANGEIVAMTGDGVNDAPALKAAHIGIAMGARGTDVAREAADLVLMDDDFSSIVAAIKSGRRIFDNLGKAIAFVIAVHVPIVGISLLPVLLQWPLLLLPVHVLLLQLVIDPACSIVFEMEAEERDIMRKPPRPRTQKLFSRELLTAGLIQGGAVFAIIYGLFAAALHQGYAASSARALTFTALIAANLGLIVINRVRVGGFVEACRRSNAALYWVIASTALVLFAINFFAPLQALLHFTSPVSLGWAMAAFAVASCLVVLELIRRVGQSSARSDA